MSMPSQPKTAHALVVAILLCFYLILLIVFSVNQCFGHKRNFSLVLRLPYFLTAELLVNAIIVTTLALACILPTWVSTETLL